MNLPSSSVGFVASMTALTDFFNRLRRNAVFLVISILNGASSLRLIDGRFHRLADMVTVHDDLAVYITSSTTDGLNQGCLGSEETFFVGI